MIRMLAAIVTIVAEEIVTAFSGSLPITMGGMKFTMFGNALGFEVQMRSAIF
jgi:hypothetical protein